MRYYIAYKYRNNKNKDNLKNKLLEISNILQNKGHTTFILGRDIQEWGKHKISTLKNLKTMLNAIRNSDELLGYIDTQGISIGLPYELLCAKILGKKINLYLCDGIKPNFLKLFTKNIKNTSELFE